MTRAPAQRTGGCLCGAVRFSARLPAGITAGACHCEMCRRWTGSALVCMALPLDAVDWQGSKAIATRQTSDWAERAWCRDCGSSLYYRVTTPGPEADRLWLALGLLDDPDGVTLASEIYIDAKPDGYAFAGEGRHLMTRQDCLAAYATQPDQGESHDRV